MCFSPINSEARELGLRGVEMRVRSNDVADTLTERCIGLKNECCDGFCFKLNPNWEKGWCLPKLWHGVAV